MTWIVIYLLIGVVINVYFLSTPLAQQKISEAQFPMSNNSWRIAIITVAVICSPLWPVVVIRKLLNR